MKRFVQPFTWRLLHLYIGTILTILLLKALISELISIQNSGDIVLIIVLLIFIGIALPMTNNYPTLKIDENNIYIWYFFRYKKIPWEQVIQIKDAPLFYNFEKSFVIEYVGSSIVHKMFGLLYNNLKFVPSVVVSHSISNLDELIDEFKKRGKASIKNPS